MMTRHRHLALLALALLAPSLATSLNDSSSSFSNDDTAETEFRLMIDAGSSGSRIYAYRHTTADRLVSPVMLPDGTQWSVKVRPGMSAVDAANMTVHLKPLIDGAMTVIPRSKHATTRVQLKATAGMRLLAVEDALQRLDAARTALGSSPFLHQPKTDAQIIPGEEEGVNGWLTVNEHLGLLRPSTQTVAVMDLGGGSTQLTMHTPEPPLAGAFPVAVHDTRWTVYTHSYLRFGMMEAWKRHRLALALDGADVDPCAWSGYRGRTELTDEDRRSATPAQQRFLDSRAGNLAIDSSRTGFDSGIRGRADPARCRRRILQLLALDAVPCTQPPCALLGVHSPRIPDGMPIYAIANYADVAAFFNCSQSTSSLRCLQQNSARMCTPRTSWSSVKARYGSTVFEWDLVQRCFAAAYIVALVGDAYGVPLDRPIVFAEDIRGRDAGWTLGAVLSELGERGAEALL